MRRNVLKKIFSTGFNRAKIGYPLELNATIENKLKNGKLYGNSKQKNSTNLFNELSFSQENSNYYDFDENGIIVKTGDGRTFDSLSFQIEVEPNTIYHIKVENFLNLSQMQIFEYSATPTFQKANSLTENGTITTGNNTKYIRIKFLSSKYPAIVGHVMISKTNEEYEPFLMPSTDYSSPIESVGNATDVESKNLFKLPESTTVAGVQYTKNADGTFNLHGTSTYEAKISVDIPASEFEHLVGKYVTTSTGKAVNGLQFRVEDYQDGVWKQNINGLNTTRQLSITNIFPQQQGNILKLSIYIAPSTTVNEDNLWVQFEEGDQPTEFEPYGILKKYVIPIITQNANLLNTQTDFPIDEPLRALECTSTDNYNLHIGDKYYIADYIDFENRKIVRNIKQRVLNGTETGWSNPTTNLFNLDNQFVDARYKSDIVTIMCNKYKALVNKVSNSNFISISENYDSACDFGSSKQLRFKDTRYTNLDDFKNDINENNVIINYILDSSIVQDFTEEQNALADKLAITNNYCKIHTDTEIEPLAIEAEYSCREATEKNGNIYGIRRKISNNTSSQWERIFDSIGLVANATHNGTNVVNDFDKLYPYKNIKSCNYNLTTKKVNAWLGDANFKFDGTNGDVFTYIPTTYWKIYQEDDYDYVLLADSPTPGFTKIDSFFIGRYNGSVVSDVLHSYSGLIPTTNKTIEHFRTLANELGDNFSQLDWRYFILQMLYLVEYADYNSQSKLGNGIMNRKYLKTLIAESNTNRAIVNNSSGYYIGQIIRIGTSDGGAQIADARKITAIEPFDNGVITGYAITFDGTAVNIAVDNFVCTMAQATGQCDALEMKSGCINNDGYHSMIYRGVENIFANIWQFIDGINIKEYVAYICKDHSQYVSDKFVEPYKPISYVNCATNGNAKTLGLDVDEPFFRFPTEIGGSSSISMCDYYYQNAGNKIACIGGTFSGGSNDGLWYLNFSNPASFANWNIGCRVLIDSK